MAQPKAATTTADTDWLKIKSWATQQKIPEAAVTNVEKLDEQRIQSGEYAMSNAERTRAILAAAGQNYNTALPSDAPKPSNIIGNTISDIRGIATGLMPTRLGANVVDTAKSTFDAVTDANKLKGSSPGATIGNYLTKTALSWLPGAADIGTVLENDPTLSNAKGFEALAEHPVSSILDVMPGLKALDSAAGSAAARTELGGALAEKVGVAPKALGQMGGVRMAGKAIGQVTIGKGKEFTDVDGNIVLSPRTISNRMANASAKLGTGKFLAKSAHVMTEGNNQATIALRDGMKEWNVGMEKLPAEQVPLLTAKMHSGMSADDLLNDHELPPESKAMVEIYRPMEQAHEQMMLESGEIISTTLPDGTSGLYLKTSPIHALVRKADQAVADANDASAKADAIQARQAQVDQAGSAVMTKVTATKDMVAGMANMLAEQANNVNKGWINTFGRLTGKGGLLEQMNAALQAGDWATLKRLSSSSRRLLEGKSMEAIGRVSHISELRDNVELMEQYADIRRKLEKQYDDAYYGKVKSRRGQSAMELNRKADHAVKKAMAHVRAHPPDMYRDLVLHKFFENFMASTNAEEILDNAAAGLKATDHDPDIVDALRSDPRKLYEVIVATSDPTFRDAFLPDMTPQDHAIFMNDALKQVDLLRAQGYKPMWVPTIGAASAAGDAIGDDRIYAGALKNPTIDATKKKMYAMGNTVNDLSMGVDRMMKQPLERAVTLHHAAEIVKPMLKPLTGLKRAVTKEHLADIKDEYAATAGGSVMHRIAHDYGYSKMDLQRVYGIKNSDLGLDDDEEYYMPSGLAKQIEIQFGRDQFPLKGVWDKSTGVFKYSILAFSPRYTAHVLFGGSMLLALRIDPRSLAFIGQAFKEVRMYHKGDRSGEIPGEVMQGTSAKGTPDTQFHFRGGTSMGVGTIQAKLAEWGIDHKFATGVQWAKAAGQVNSKFTDYIGDMQRSIAYLDGVKKAERGGSFLDPITGESIRMTTDRAHFEGMQAAERVMGNLQAMTPLERGVARKIMPFYGWTKHIIKYVLTYPVDHPWRTMFLSTLASQNSERFSSGLDERMQLLFFLGSPDTNGNVTAVDARQLDPFRDVANYATLGGWISSMNPIITAPFAAIDPQIIYGGNVLHPNISYDSFYGTNTAGGTGGGLEAAEQEIPELSAVDQALGMSAQARSIKASGGSGKAILNAVGVPWAPQKLNLQQISAKHEIDRYNQSAADALNAWQSGDFSTIKNYPANAQLPDPLNKAYNITPAQLESLYNAALKANPSAPPSETVPDLVSPSL